MVLLDNDCMLMIISYVDAETLAQCRQLSKKMYEQTKKYSIYVQFQKLYNNAVKKYNASEKLPLKKKRKLYAIVDVLTNPTYQKYWREKRFLSKQSRAEMQARMYIVLTSAYIPMKRRLKYMKNLKKYDLENGNNV